MSYGSDRIGRMFGGVEEVEKLLSITRQEAVNEGGE